MNLRNDGLTFDDVLLVPKFSSIESRSSIDLSTVLCEKKDFRLSLPIISANMKTVTDGFVAHAMACLGGYGFVHRFMSVEENVQGVMPFRETVGCSVGARDGEKVRADALILIGIKHICVDLAHGDSKMAFDMVHYIAKKYPDVILVAGNVSTLEGAKRLVDAGADAIRVGIGPGSLCTTRIETGNGVPQLTALEDVYNYRMACSGKFGIIADGGIKNSGDIVKALCFSDAVMVGNLIAGSDETPGQVVEIDGKKYRRYEGSSTHKNSHIEGVKALVPARGPLLHVIKRLAEGIRSGLSYQGARNLSELRRNPEFIRISALGIRENNHHDVIV